MRRYLAAITSTSLAQRVLAFVVLVSVFPALAAGQPPGDKKAEQPASNPEAAGKPTEQSRPAIRIDIPLPIVDTVDTLVKGRIARALQALPEGSERPVLILEFRPQEGTAGEGSDFERSLSLARYFSGERLGRVQTVAYLPQSIKGHAVLSVLACEQIIIAPDAELGAAGSDEKEIDAILRRGYSEIADRRRTIPAAVALGLLDKNLAVFKVTTPTGILYELSEALPDLRSDGKVIREDIVFQQGDEHLLTGTQMRAMSFATHLANDRSALAAALQLPRTALQESLAPEAGWKPILVELKGPVHKQQVNFVLRNIRDHQRRDDFNLIVLRIRSAGGSIEQSLRLAQALADLDARYHTVAFVDKEARGDAALLAWACNELAVTEQALLGGPGEESPSSAQIDELRAPLEQLAKLRDRDWSIPLALIDARQKLYRYNRAAGSEARYLTTDEAEALPDAQAWQRDDRPLATEQGISGALAQEIGLARHLVRDFADFMSVYQIEGDIQAMRPNWALAAVEWLADPRIAGLLLFVAWFALMIEMSTPGVGAPGFVAGLCFLLYFWSQFLHGTAGWLEVLLFLGGFACLAIELVALPGTGVFGLGGGLMILSSIVLASQTFVVPQNAYQFRQVPTSLFVVAAGMAGAVVSILAIRRFLPDTPYFNRMLLRPPQGEELEELGRRESLVSWDYLSGKRGTTMTQLTPSGKAQFGDDLVDVIADGELIERGTAVYVVEVVGNRVVVRRA